MERDFGVKLFDRTRAGYELSLAGIEIFEAVSHLEAEFDEIGRKVFGRDQRLTGNLRITCTEVMANLYLSGHLGRFMALHPEIDLNIVCTFQALSLSRREADIAVRVTSQPPETLIGRRLATAAVAVYGAAGTSGGAPGDWSWIGWQDEAYTRMLISEPFPDARIRHRVDDMQTMRAMVRHGLGVAVLPCYMADIDPGLRRVIADPVPGNELGLWVLYHPDVRRVARVRLFTDFIAAAITADRDLFEGRRPRSQD